MPSIRTMPASGREDAAQHVHQRRLAGAVLADEADDLAGAHGEAHGIQRHDARIALPDADQLEEWHEPCATCPSSASGSR
jgi:hypothetical protein